MNRGLSALKRLVDHITRRFDYHGHYPAVVDMDYGDMTLDLSPSPSVLSANLPPMTSIPFKAYLPGLIKVKVKIGSMVMLAFEQGDPAKPVAYPYIGTQMEYLLIQSGLGGLVEIDDDRGVKSGDDVYVKPFVRVKDMYGHEVYMYGEKAKEFLHVKTGKGHQITMVDEPGKEMLEARDFKGQTVKIDSVDGQEKITFTDLAGQGMTFDAVAQVVSLTTLTKFLVNGGGVPVAKLGDAVAGGVVVGPGSLIMEVAQ